MLGKIEGKRRRGQQGMRWLGGITDSMGLSLSKPWKIVKNREAWHAAVHEVTKNHNGLVTEQQQISLSVLYLHFTNFDILYFYFLQFSLSFEFSVEFVFNS